jgi:DNA-binding XRE family transcriptional regulator
MTTLRDLREGAGLTQSELAARAGVSRQLVGAAEAGRNLPRVDAALSIANVLGAEVADIFGPSTQPVSIVSGIQPREDALVRAGRVGDLVVTAPARLGPDGFDIADGVIVKGLVQSFGQHGEGLVVAGCEPGLQVLEGLLRADGMGAVAAIASSVVAKEALAAGRVHAAVVHGPRLGRPKAVERLGLSSWRVGLAAPPEASIGWVQEALSGTTSVIQREEGAGVQRTFEKAVGASNVPGPRVTSHLAAAYRSLMTGLPAVTIEPAALAVGSQFYAIEVHQAQMWVAPEWVADPVVSQAINLLATSRFQHRLAAVGGYDLSRCGARIA